MDPQEVELVVATLGKQIATRYVFPDVGERAAARLDDGVSTRRYFDAADPAALARLLTDDLMAVSGDGHLRLIHHADPIADVAHETLMSELVEREVLRSMSRIARVERLAGNVGLLEFQPALFDAALVGSELAAAMTIVRHTRALIIDLRCCTGSDPASVAYFCSYLLPPHTHLNTVYDRLGDSTTQYWTLPFVPGPRYGIERPVHVLTSRMTFSGGEELAYVLRLTGRATLVGDVTGGGAHPRIGERVHPHLEVSIPVARTINPITGTDWEGVGVEPHIFAGASDALQVALDDLRISHPGAADA